MFYDLRWDKIIDFQTFRRPINLTAKLKILLGCKVWKMGNFPKAGFSDAKELLKGTNYSFPHL